MGIPKMHLQWYALNITIPNVIYKLYKLMTGSERTKLCQVLVIQIINNEVLV